jgi:hypothetical protein
MSYDAEKHLDELLAKLRKLKGISPLTSKEADDAFNAAPEEPLSKSRMESIVNSVLSGELVSWEPVPELGWTNDMNFDEIEENAMQLYRNKGEDDRTDSTEDELRHELLRDDDESKESNEMDGGTEPPGNGR